uniref:UDP-N-acetylglucosamine diphosphorylase n=1 Tax=Meloidogyne incognita TaxID=6306 RepID=A0A914LQ50_MELIC
MIATLKNIAPIEQDYYDRKLAVITLAGGQASRLGSSLPKGIINLGTGLGAEKDSLLFLQACQISYLQKKAKGRIIWLVMTSKTTDAKIREHLDIILKKTNLDWKNRVKVARRYGKKAVIANAQKLPKWQSGERAPVFLFAICKTSLFLKFQVMIFIQNEIPAHDFDGQPLLSAPDRPVTSPDGNGGIYQAILPKLPELEEMGIEYFHVYCVDNILCRVPDLHMIGFAVDNKADCVLKVIEKKDPSEKVGHVCVEDGKIKVLEYSEIPKELAEKRDPKFPEKLFFRAGNIANHFFTLDFLKKACLEFDSLPYHEARKRIPYWDPATGRNVQPNSENGIKKERFIFDAFIHSKCPKNFMVWQVPREEEFSPLKNPDSAGVDCLSTCIRDFTSVNGNVIREMVKEFCKKE